LPSDDANAQPDRPRITIIIARARNGTIGRDNALPWHLPEDLRHFRQTTTGHPIVMGRRTYEAIGRPLPQRRNIVVTRDPGWARPGVETAGSLPAALDLCAGEPEVFVIGGAQLYAEAIDVADRLILTQIDADFEGDVFLPAPSPQQWFRIDRQPGQSSTGLTYSIDVYHRVRARG